MGNNQSEQATEALKWASPLPEQFQGDPKAKHYATHRVDQLTRQKESNKKNK